MTSFHSHSSEETIQFGISFARSLQNGDVVALSGDLGTGKTHFIAGVCMGLGVRGHVASPTFTIINEYPAVGRIVVHIDLYRITSPYEVAGLGIEEYFTERHICLIEWAERMTNLPPSAIRVRFAYGENDSDRLIAVERMGNKAVVEGEVAPCRCWALKQRRPFVPLLLSATGRFSAKPQSTRSMFMPRDSCSRSMRYSGEDIVPSGNLTE